MTPPDQLRHAANLLDQAKRYPNCAEPDRLLAEAHDICATTAANIRELLAPSIEAIGGAFGRQARGR